jgi:FecR-like protein
MTEQDHAGPADDRGGEPDAIERLVRSAGRRSAVDPDRARRVRVTVHGAWRDLLRRRTRVRRWMFGGVVLAAAAGLVLVASLPRRPATARIVVPPSPTARVIALSGAMRTIGGSAGVARVGDMVAIGSGFETGASVLATFALDGGGEARVNEGTVVRFTGVRELSIDRGTVYLDSGPRSGLIVRTPVGVVRDIGTRFEVGVINGEPGTAEASGMREISLRVRVRDGAVRYDRGSVQRKANAGRELIVGSDGQVVERSVDTFGPDWAWVVRAAPVFKVESQTLSAFLDWVARESGRRIEFADDRLRRSSSEIILHGSIEGLTDEEALDVILPTSGLTYRIDSQRVIVSRAGTPAPGGAR